MKQKQDKSLKGFHSKRGQWKSRVGFIWAAVGSAVGLGNLWRFPYVVGQNGGASFVFLYLICLFLVGFPVLISEILIGRKGQLNPSGSFQAIGRSRIWKGMGKLTILTGFLVSGFYAVISAWTLGYLLQALLRRLTHFQSSQEAAFCFATFSASSLWTVGSLAVFISLSVWVLYTGIQKGIEMGNQVMMPLLFLLLSVLAVKGLFMSGGKTASVFLFQPKWSAIRPQTVLIALGQAFFALSLGQGTMVTYGSYLGKRENIPMTCLPIPVFGVCISLLAGLATFAIVFSAGLSPCAGESLMFETLPMIFSQMPGGYFLCLFFFLLLVLAALTSQISAMEPLISYLIDTWKWRRGRAVCAAGIAVFIAAFPCALSFGSWKEWTLFGKTIFDCVLFLSLNVLIPIGGLAAVILVGWRWGFKKAFPYLREGGERLFDSYPFLSQYLKISIQYVSPFIIIVILLDLLGFFT